MSAKPFAKGYGIIAGVLILWAAWFALFWVGAIVVKAWFGGGGEAG